MTKTGAQSKLAEILRPINSREATFDSTTLLEDFLTRTYFPIHRRRWKESTYKCNDQRVHSHICKEYGERCVSSITRDELQTFLERKADSGLSFSIVDHLRWDLSQIFTLARAEGLILRNPAELLITPKNAATPQRLVMEMEDVRKCISILTAPRERLIFKLATLGGMRPGEILALQWKHLGQDSANIQQRLYRGELDTPKTRKSTREAALTIGIGEDITAWRMLSVDVQPDAWVFPSERAKPLARDNAWRRYIQPIFEKAGLGWVTFQVMRRSHSTLMNGLKMVDPKLIADQLGHTLDVNQNVYTMPNLASRKEAVNLLESALQNA